MMLSSSQLYSLHVGLQLALLDVGITVEVLLRGIEDCRMPYLLYQES